MEENSNEINDLLNQAKKIISELFFTDDLLENLLEFIRPLISQNKIIAIIFCRKLIQELNNLEDPVKNILISSFIKGSIELMCSVSDKVTSITYEFPNSANFISYNSDEINKDQTLLDLYEKTKDFQDVSILLINQILWERYGLLKKLKTGQSQINYSQLKSKLKLKKYFDTNQLINTSYINRSLQYFEGIYKLSQSFYLETNKFIGDLNRFNEKVINLNEEMIQRLEKYLIKQQRISIELNKSLFKRQEEAKLKESEIKTHQQNLEDSINKFYEDKIHTENIVKQMSIFELPIRDLVIYAIIYLFVGIFLGYLIPSFNLADFFPKKYS